MEFWSYTEVCVHAVHVGASFQKPKSFRAGQQQQQQQQDTSSTGRDFTDLTGQFYISALNLDHFKKLLGVTFICEFRVGTDRNYIRECSGQRSHELWPVRRIDMCSQDDNVGSETSVVVDYGEAHMEPDQKTDCKDLLAA